MKNTEPMDTLWKSPHPCVCNSYVLGLGDRHPSNLMISQHTGAVAHIDFGDCFEVAQQREQYPERLPFRIVGALCECNRIPVLDVAVRWLIACYTEDRLCEKYTTHKEELLASVCRWRSDSLMQSVHPCDARDARIAAVHWFIVCIRCIHCLRTVQ